MEMASSSSSGMETENCEEMILFVDTDSVDDVESVLRAVRKKCKKMDVSVVMDTGSKEIVTAGSSNGVTSPSKSSKKKVKVREKFRSDKQEESAALQDQLKGKKKLNGRLKRLLAKKERMRLASESQEDTTTMDEVETNSTDSGIDMTDLIVNFHVSKSRETELTCGQCRSGPSNSKHWKRKRSGDNSDDQISNKKVCTGHLPVEYTLPINKYDKSRIVALDCEFVGVGHRKTSGLGRCSIISYDGKVLCDIYAKPKEPITDYRTPWSGIRKKDMVNAVPFSHAQNHIRRILQDKIIVGHALHYDFRVLGIYPPAQLVRDTSKYIPLRTMLAEKLGQDARETYSLKIFSRHLLGRHIQGGEHCSVEDSIAALDLYKLIEENWEADVAMSTTSATLTASKLNEGNCHSYFEDSYWPDDVLDDDLD